MRFGVFVRAVALGLAVGAVAMSGFVMSGVAIAQDTGKAPAAAPKAAPKATAAAPKGKTMVLLCPQGKSNIDCGSGEQCCYQPLFDTGSCQPAGSACLGVVNPLPRVAR